MKTSALRQVWLWPLFLVVVTLVGLVTALIGDGVWDVFAWILLSIPLATLVLFLRRAH